MSNPLLEIKDLNINYGTTNAVKDISFELHRGEILGFLGLNGAGKSSTMQAITGNLATQAGSIKICGMSLFEQGRAAKRHIGYLPEIAPLYTQLTINEYLYYCAQLHGVSKNKIQHCINNSKQRCGLTHNENRLIKNLSKGYQQRVGIAQAILHNPDILILDEPTVGLDPAQIREIRRLIQELGEDHGILLSSHILPEIQDICNRVLILHQGKIVLNESIRQLQQQARQSLQLGFRNPPDNEQLLQIKGVDAVDTETSCTRVWFSKNNPGDEILQQAIQQDWGLYKLNPEEGMMEQVFIQLTCNDEPPNTNTGQSE
ncbi:MAG: ABC transporter ATP-binding protein [Gammaproteobacteria bacterium]|nr:ABC transporter ATP-binding protein [Gammaproteobacteria bacterium]